MSILRRIVEVMAPESKGALGVVSGLEDASFTAVSLSAGQQVSAISAQLASNVSSSLPLAVSGGIPASAEVYSNSQAHGLPATAVNQQVLAARSQSSGMALAK